MPDTTQESYVDIYLLPVPRGNMDAYQRQATAFGQITKEYGALRYREFVADGTGEGMEAEDGTALTAAVVEFTSQAHRDEVMGLVMADPRVEESMQGEPTADMSKMRYGGFAPLVTL